MEEISRKRKVRGGHRGYLTRKITEIEESKDDVLKLRQMEDTLKEQMGIIEGLDKEILEELSRVENDNANDCSEEIGESCQFKDKVSYALLQIEDFKQKLMNPNSLPTLPTLPTLQRADSIDSLPSLSSFTRKQRVKLPKMEIKRFSGSPQEWQEFWDNYKSAVHENEELSDIDKFSYLRHFLEDSARKVISGLELTAVNYKEAIKLLEKRFAKPEIIKNAHINSIIKAPTIFNERSVGRIRELLDLVENHHRGLQALKVDEASYSSILVPVVMDKIPSPVRLSMIRGSENKATWKMSEMLQALGTELDIREQHVSLFSSGNNPTLGEREKLESRARRAQPTTGSALLVKQDGGKRKCTFCHGDHGEASCNAVEDPKERKKIVLKQGRCFICLSKGHRAFECRFKALCKLCKQAKHHVSLCSGSINVNSPAETPSLVSNAPPANLANATSCVGSTGYGGRGILQTAQAIATGVRNLKVRVLFDTGSHKTFVTSRVVRGLSIGPKRVDPLGIKTFGSKMVDEKMREVVELELVSVNGKNRVKIEAYVVDRISDVSNEHVEVVKKDYPHLSSVWFSDICTSQDILEVDILVGIDYLWDIQEDEVIRGEPGQPVAVKTKLGWVLSGPLRGKNVQGLMQSNISLVIDSTALSKKQKLEEDVHKLWDLETLGIKRGDEVYEDLLDRVEFSGERYSVSLPWKLGHKPLPSNYANSLCRLKSQMGKLKKNPAILEACNNIIKEQEEAGIIEKVNSLEKADKIHYLPHQTVIRTEAETTKVRMVFDASSKDKQSGTSLNNCIHVGPPLNPLLFDIMIRFREHKVAIVGDIEKAFLNVEVNPKDRDCLRFLWVSDLNTPEPSIDVYRFNRVVFGVNCSPFLLNAVLRYHLSKYAEKDPDFATKMSNSFYVDDLVSGATDVESGLQLYEKARLRMKEGGFNLRKWRTNDLGLESEIERREGQKTTTSDSDLSANDETYAKETLGKEDNKQGKTKVLGTAWDIGTDRFEFDLTKFGAEGENDVITKRTILSMLAKLFDPLGLVSPIIVSAKVLFQELCTRKLGWDEEIPLQQGERWKKLVSDLNSVGEITIHRCLYKGSSSKVKHCSLHGFADASKRAYCATVYLVYETEEGIFSSLVCAKTRVAPLKELTIPRLELMSARILASLMDTVYKALQPQVKIDSCRYWLDSKTALYWINNAGLWRQFVQHRVNEILGLSSKENWGHCAGVCNPADLGSRGVSASTLKNSRLWWEGPFWLFLGREQWPDNSNELIEQSKEVGEEMKNTTAVLAVVEDKRALGISKIFDIKRFSSLNKLLRSTCWVLRFIDSLKSKGGPRENNDRHLRSEEISKAERLWIEEVQKEMRSEANYKQISQQFGVYEDKNLLRCKGRIEYANIEYEAKHPILLPGEHYFTELIILNCHERVHHNGLAATLSELRSRFWVTKGRQRVKGVIRKCRNCIRVQGKAYSVPPVAALPEFRVESVPPFTNVGIDFAGPLYFKTKDAKMEKCYIVLYSCCTTRALHLDKEEGKYSKRFWYLMQKLNHFISRWRKEYLLDLREHEKNKGNKEAAVKKGDIVLIYEDNVKRTEWKMGRIEELLPGKYGITRGVKVRTCGKGKYELLNRPLQKLYPLEVSSNEAESFEKETNVDGGECEQERDPGGRAKRSAAKDSEWKTCLMLDSC